MNPVYLDLHIHTSENPNSLNENYKLDALIEKVKGIAQGDDFLISFTDHNTINEKVYLEATKKISSNVILGVELHIRNYNDADPYHCHLYFNEGIKAATIKEINEKLNSLYENKVVEKTDKSIPKIEDILKVFDKYDFILLPHGGQSHSTFNSSIPSKNVEFDNTMERGIYYNSFDGFTARSNKKLEETQKYFEKLGIKEFVNLVTCTDNYDPAVYPAAKAADAGEFIPTWMFATPIFEGLRLSLSDSSRLVYSHEKPKEWRESIKSIKLQNDNIDIDVHLTPGLNVIIGESSSGKSLFVDSLVRKIAESGFEDSKYNKYSVDNIEVNYPQKLVPHYIEQNFISSVATEDKKIDDIEIIKKILPDNSNAREKVKKGLEELNGHLDSLFYAVEQIEGLEKDIIRIPVLSSLMTSEEANENILKQFLNTLNSLKHTDYNQSDEDFNFLDEIDKKLSDNPFVEHDKQLIKELKKEIVEMKNYSFLENDVKRIIRNKKNCVDQELREKEGESQIKKQDFDTLIEKMREYYDYLLKFEQTLSQIAKYSIDEQSDKIEIEGYILSVENKFKLNEEILKDELNNLLLKGREIISFNDISPEKLFKANFRSNHLKGGQKGSGATYKSIKENIYAKFIENDKTHCEIKTPDKISFGQLSPGLKTSIILELILNFEEDAAPLIIDQPEDNLATSYINNGLVKSIKKMKSRKQIIFVSHNATIPMAGDAQNVVLCENNSGKIRIRSNPLEGKINDISVVDHIARIADGGKPSIKKRFKKYNLKKYRE